MGYDFLALNAMTARNSIIGFGKQIGVGKESGTFGNELKDSSYIIDIFIVVNEKGEEMALKLARLILH
jgi:RIO kinase 2